MQTDNLSKIHDLMKRMNMLIGNNVMLEYYDILANDGKPQVLNEITVKRVIEKHGQEGFIIVSANITGRDNRTTNLKTKELVSDIRQTGYSYLPVYGGYKGTNGVVDNFEPSFLVFNYSRDGSTKDFSYLKDFAIKMCDKYEQNSVLVVYPGGKATYINGLGKEIAYEDGDTILNDPTQEYFTSLIKTQSIDKEHPERSKRWTYQMRFKPKNEIEEEWHLYANPNPCTLNEMQERDYFGEILLKRGKEDVF